MVSVDLSIDVSGDSGIKDMIERLKAADNQVVEAGVFGGFAADKAMWNEYGTSRGIPARPFLRNTLYEKSASWAVFVKPVFQSILEGGSPDIAGKLGPKMADDIRSTIDGGGFAPLAASTIARKGSSKPLVDTGDMYGSITWKKG
ncbi:hypothetical protein [Lacticaseibacillus zhaodongensis]|uniref:hypothetical protein n=1 Tax=Lacticaseibacillus zhaodongensis TaxID=2668065 RepID=UPI0012D34750|nr:hypothetical protein [Lacticaseibacillus zhaodongensis]